MPPLRSGQRRKALSEACLIRRSVRPEFRIRFQRGPKPHLGDAFWMIMPCTRSGCATASRNQQDHHNPACTVHSGSTDRFRKVLHDFRDMIEGIGECFRIWRVAMSKPG